MATREQLGTSSDTSRRRIHILSVIDDLHFGGDEYRLLAFAQSLDASRFQHAVVTLMKADSVTGERYGSMREQYHRAGVRLLDLGQSPIAARARPGTSKLRSFKEKVQRLKALVREEKVDVLDVHLDPANPICAAASLGTGIPFVVTLYQVTTMRSAKFALAGQFNLGSAALLITDSNAQASRIRDWLLRKREIRVIPNGTPPPQPVLLRGDVLRLLNIRDEPALTIIGQISSLVSYKGHLVLLEAAKQVLERHPECLFLLVGYERRETGYRESLLQRASDLGIAERVRIAGYPGPIGDVWNIVNIHAHASVLDSLPNALLEAMSLGTPSVVTSVGGIPEAIDHGMNGFLVSPGNPDQLARHLLLLLEDSGLRTKLGLAAYATYSRRFRPDVMTRQLEDCFGTITSGVAQQRTTLQA
jgi:glycosyltransferase involved in cell wall biosynthesis